MRKIKLLMVSLVASAMLCACSKTAGDYNKEGMKFYENGDYRQAEEYLAKAVSMDANNVTYLQNHAMTLIQQGKPDEAIAALEKTIVLDKDNEKTKKNNKYASRGIGMAYMEKLDYESAVASFKDALSYDVRPEWDTDIRYYLANATFLMGDVNAAIDLYDDIIDVDPANGLAYKARANIYRDKGEYQEALSDYNNALIHTEGGFEIYIGLAACYLETGKKEQSDEALFLASLLDVKTERDKYYLGVVHYYQGKYDSAKAEMEYALANGISEAYFYLGEINLILEDYEAALESFIKYKESTVIGSATLCNDLSVCYIASEDYENAINWIEKGLLYSNSNVQQQLMRNKVACLENQGDLEGAYKAIFEYCDAYRDDSAAMTELHWLAERLGYEIAENPFANSPQPAPETEAEE